MGKRTNSAVWLEKQQRWQIKVQKNGERRSFTSATPGRTGQREANRKADAWLDDGVLNTRLLVETVYPQWITNLELTTGRSNCAPVWSRWRRRVQPVVGRKRIEDLSEQALQTVVNKAYAAGLSKKSLMNVCADLRAFCKWMRLSKISTLRPEALHVPKGARSQEKEILQPDALRVLFSVSTTLYKGVWVTDPYINAYRFSAITGLRPGELIGLRWQDIRGSTVCIRRAVNIHGETTQGKNQNAVRAFALTRTAAQILDAQRDLNLPGDSVFGIQSESTYRHCWKRYCVSNEIKYVPPYNLRHTFVSLAKTLPEGSVKALVGHSKQMDTFGVYAHLIQGEDVQTAAMLDNVFDRVIGADQ